MAKIIPLLEATPPLTPLMIEALKEACDKESKQEPFGQVDLQGSFAALLKRGLIAVKTIIFQGTRKITWYVTRAGKYTLKKLGFSSEC